MSVTNKPVTPTLEGTGKDGRRGPLAEPKATTVIVEKKRCVCAVHIERPPMQGFHGRLGPAHHGQRQTDNLASGLSTIPRLLPTATATAFGEAHPL